MQLLLISAVFQAIFHRRFATRLPATTLFSDAMMIRQPSQ